MALQWLKMSTLRGALCLVFVVVVVIVASVSKRGSQTTYTSIELNPADVQGLECAQSGYCSIGRVQPFTGDIAKSSQFRKCLEARSFKKEIIVTTTISDVPELDKSIQVYSDLKKLGMEHVVIQAYSELSCTKMQQAMPALPCVWSSDPASTSTLISPALRLAQLRLTFMLRAARLGYNVLALVPEVVVQADPYRYLKQAPLNDVNLWAMARGHCHVDTSVLYISQAAPAGPAVQIVADTVDRLLRWIDDDGETLSRFGKSLEGGLCVGSESDLLGDSLASALAGVPLMPHAQLSCRRPSDFRTQVVNNSAEVLRCGSRLLAKHHKLPAEMQVSSDEGESLVVAPIMTPALGDYPPLSFGGSLLPAKRGQYSAWLRSALQQDCPKCPQLQDVWEQGAQSFDAPTAPLPPLAADLIIAQDKVCSSGKAPGRDCAKEKFGWLPVWLAGGLFAHNRRPTGKQVISHMALAHPEKHGAEALLAVRRGMGRFCYNTSRSLHQGLNDGGEWSSGSFKAGGPSKLLRLLATPAALKQLASTFDRWQDTLVVMVQLSLWSRRTLVWPSLPCDLPWLKNTSHGAHPGQLNRWVLPYSPPQDQAASSSGDVSSTELCLPTPMTAPACMRTKSGLFQSLFEAEAQRWAAGLGANVSIDPSPANTVLLMGKDSVWDYKANGLPVVDGTDLLPILEAKAEHAVLYIAVPTGGKSDGGSRQSGEDMVVKVVHKACPLLSMTLKADGHFSHTPPPALHPVHLAGKTVAEMGLTDYANTSRFTFTHVVNGMLLPP